MKKIYKDLSKFYELKRYFGKPYLVAIQIKPTKIKITEEDAKEFQKAKEEVKQENFYKLKLQNIQYGRSNK